jgi:Putative prokaryotic signal transducing protein
MTDSDEQNPARLEQVFTSIDALQVRIARDFLERGGIETFIFDGESSRMLGSTAAVEARLMVHADRADEARERLRELGFIG